MTSIDVQCPPLPVPPSLPLFLFSHPIPSKRSVDSASPNQRPVRRLSGLLSRGRSNLATSLRHKLNWREKSDKSTISPPYTSHLVPTRTRAHALSFFLSFVISISCHLPIPPSSLPPSLFCLSLAPPVTAKVNNLESCQHSYRPRARHSYRVSARSLEFAEPLAKIMIFLGQA